jgi:hypothetical protein
MAMAGLSRLVPEARAPLARRRLLRLAVSAAVAGWVAPGGAAPVKVSKAAALYQDQPRDGLSCAACTLFRPPAACAAVEGRISPHGWCRFFDLPD